MPRSLEKATDVKKDFDRTEVAWIKPELDRSILVLQARAAGTLVTIEQAILQSVCPRDYQASLHLPAQRNFPD